jgi:hypothetical protein
MVEPASPHLRVLISYSHDSETHRQTVRTLAQRLRDRGVDAQIDQFEKGPPNSWSDWMRRELDMADRVLVVVTEEYRRRFDGDSPEGVGDGARWEGTLIKRWLYRSRHDKARFLPVLLRAEDHRHIPPELDTSSYVIGETGEADLSKLLRDLHGIPDAVPADLGDPFSAPASPGHYTGLHSSRVIEEALIQAREGSADTAMRQLWEAQSGLQGDQRAQAAYLTGVLCHQLGHLKEAQQFFQWVVAETQHEELCASAQGMAELVDSEFNELCGKHGPVTAAQNWLNLLRRKWRTRDAIWKNLDTNLRLALAQDWIIANAEHPWFQGQDFDTLAKSLAHEKPYTELATHLVEGRVKLLREGYSEWNPDTWQLARVPRRIGLDYVIVALGPASGQQSTQFSFLMRRVGRDWRVANFQPAYVIPGRPPRQEEIPGALSSWGA